MNKLLNENNQSNPNRISSTELDEIILHEGREYQEYKSEAINYLKGN